ncbi:Nucleic acid-binding OB-fold-like protein [Zea mays]|uniref:Nucleic acid-binding OB-fold-like protein n=1 Tax=Zea mays TaxID=4577 RepID=A0A1D6G944_MAIZE|nr:Nucleic acid-binding OB-fold-like protein [Zea mays]
MVFHIKLCYLMQNTVGAGTTLQKINVTKSDFDPPSHPRKADKKDAESSSKKAISVQKTADKSNGSADSKKSTREVVCFAIKQILVTFHIYEHFWISTLKYLMW